MYPPDKSAFLKLCREQNAQRKACARNGAWDDDARRRVLKRSEAIDAIQAIRLYVKEERGKMGPSFLESVARAVRVNEKLRTLLKDKGMEFEGHQRRGVTDMLKMYQLPTTPQVNRVKEALVLSSLELHAVVEDPLPDALRIAQSLWNTSEQANGRNNVSKSSFMARNGTACTFEIIKRGGSMHERIVDSIADYRLLLTLQVVQLLARVSTFTIHWPKVKCIAEN